MNEAEKLYRRGTELLDNYPEQAINLLSQSLELNPDALPAIYNRIVAYARVGRDMEAVADLERLKKLAPEIESRLRAELALSAEPYTDIARAEYRAGRFDMAIKKCEAALAYDPRYADAFIVKGIALGELGEVDKALQCYNNAAKLDPGNYWAFINRAELHYKQKRLREAISDYSRSIELRPQEANAYAGRSAVFADLQMPDKAAEDNRKVAELRDRPERIKDTQKLRDYLTRLRALGCNPPPNPVDSNIEALEASIGVPLPANYHEFLVRCGGWWGDVLCSCREPTPFGYNHVIAGFCDAGQVRNHLNSMIVPRNMVTIGYGHFEKYTCLSVAGIDRGFVYALDAEFRVHWSDEKFNQRFDAIADNILGYLELRREGKLPEKPVGYDSLYLLAEDFAEFLSNCRSNFHD